MGFALYVCGLVVVLSREKLGLICSNMKDRKFIILYSRRHEEYDLFADLKCLDDVHLEVCDLKDVRSNVLRFLRSIHLSGELARFLHVPLKKKWFRKLDLDLNPDELYYLVIVDKALEAIPITYLKQLTENKNITSVLLLLNSTHSSVIKYIQREIEAVKWDAVFTFDENDAKTKDYDVLEYNYYSKREENDILNRFPADRISDVYYIGILKNSRKNLLFDIYDYLRRNSIRVEFHLMHSILSSLEFRPYKDEIDYYTSKRGLIPYDQVLASVIYSKTILEIVGDGQTGPTLRYYEAVCYNKKLLTNNPNIMNFPFYNDRYMRVFNSPQDIDINWLRSNETVEYGYNDEFSPVHLLEMILKRLG